MSEPRLQLVAPGRAAWRAPELPGPAEDLGALLAAAGQGPRPVAGRGVVASARIGGADAVVRAYRRGGALRGVLPDVFIFPARALAEVRALLRLAPLGLAPRPLALEATGPAWLGARAFVRLRLAVERVAGARNLLELALSEPARIDARLGRAAGRAVAGMHAAGVAHPDLNVGNILVLDGPQPSVRLVDFDGARVGEGPVDDEERMREVLRLARSLDKWRPTAAAPAAARAAFVRAALPPALRLRAWRAARDRAGRPPRDPA